MILHRIDFEAENGAIVLSAVALVYGHKGELERKAANLAKKRATQYGTGVKAIAAQPLNGDRSPKWNRYLEQYGWEFNDK